MKQFWPYNKKSGQITNIKGFIGDLENVLEIDHLFANVAKKLASKIAKVEVPLLDFPCHPPVFEFCSIYTLDAAILVRELKPSASYGIDGLMANLIKKAVPSVYSAGLTSFFH